MSGKKRPSGEFMTVGPDGELSDLQMHAEILQEDDLLDEAAQQRKRWAERQKQIDREAAIDAMPPAQVLNEYMDRFGFPPFTGIGMDLDIAAPAMRKALKTGTALTEEEGEALDEKMHGKMEDNVYW